MDKVETLFVIDENIEIIMTETETGEEETGKLKGGGEEEPDIESEDTETTDDTEGGNKRVFEYSPGKNRCSLCEAEVSNEDGVVVGIDVEPDETGQSDYTMKDEKVLCRHCADSLFGYEENEEDGRFGVNRKKGEPEEASNGIDIEDLKELISEMEDIIVIFIIFFFVTLWVIF